MKIRVGTLCGVAIYVNEPLTSDAWKVVCPASSDILPVVLELKCALAARSVTLVDITVRKGL